MNFKGQKHIIIDINLIKINSFGYPEICDNYYDPLREDFPKTQKLG